MTVLLKVLSSLIFNIIFTSPNPGFMNSGFMKDNEKIKILKVETVTITVQKCQLPPV